MVSMYVRSQTSAATITGDMLIAHMLAAVGSYVGAYVCVACHVKHRDAITLLAFFAAPQFPEAPPLSDSLLHMHFRK